MIGGSGDMADLQAEHDEMSRQVKMSEVNEAIKIVLSAAEAYANFTAAGKNPTKWAPDYVRDVAASRVRDCIYIVRLAEGLIDPVPTCPCPECGAPCYADDDTYRYAAPADLTQ